MPQGRLDDKIEMRIQAMLHARSDGLTKGEPLSPPIVTASKFMLSGEPDGGYLYGRFANPTVEACEAAISALEGAPALAFPSGMAACTAAIMAVTRPGQHILVPSDGYYTVRVLLEEFLAEGGRKVTVLPTRAFDEVALDGFDAVWAETPSNPGLDTCDLRGLAAKARAAGAALIVDNTTPTCLLQQPLDLDGSDIRVTFSMGAAIYPIDGDDMETLFSHADRAMFYAKAQGRNH
jgi:cystathionine gamma-lyase